MGAAESTSRTNGTNQEEEERKQKASTVVGAAATIAAVGVAAWGISRTNGNNQEEEERKKKSNTVVGAAATIASVGVAAWGISRMLSDNTDSQENESAMKMKMIAEPSYVSEGLSQTSDNTWSPPPQGRLKMNTDGSCRPKEVDHDTYGDYVERGPSGYGGILRDHNCDWRRAFTGYIGVTDSLTAEFHGILKGLEFLDKLHDKEEAILETDSEPAYLWLIKPYKECSKSQRVKEIWDIIETCRRLVEKNNIKINHVSKGANKCADKLADVARENKVEYMEIKDLPKEIDQLVTEDAKLSKLR